MLAARASAQEPQPAEKIFSDGVAALHQGDHAQAIALFEALADRGVGHPDVTYDRGIAYLARVRAKAERPGDLGRAAAAFEETLHLRPGDEDASIALDAVRAEVARRRARKAGEAEMEARPSLDRIVVELAPEAAWAYGALVASLVLTIGLILRRIRRGPLHLTGVIAVPVGAVFLVLFAPLAARARHMRAATYPAVVIVPEARMLDDQGVPTTGEPIPEAARVDVVDRKGALAEIRHGTREGWTHASSLRVIAR
jgi:hypothetical protein